jgi:cobyric acid synthase CobQ/L-threonine-O-3-phosphate decarboxylase
MEAYRHGGHLRQLAAASGRAAEELLDFSANINPLGPPSWLRLCVSRALDQVSHYPDPHCQRLADKIAARHGLESGTVVCGNGTAELMAFLPRVLPARRAVIPVPAYVDYRRCAEQAGLPVELLPLQSAADFVVDLTRLESILRPGDLVFLGHPNNPTGQLLDAATLRALAANHSQVFFMVDEAFADFVEGFESMIKDRPANVVVMRSLTKFYAIAGLRLGYAVADPPVAGALRDILPPWSVNSLAQAVGEQAFRGSGERLRHETVTLVAEQRQRLQRELSQLPGVHVVPAAANYLLVRLERSDWSAPDLAAALLKEGIALRLCNNYEGLVGDYLRLAVRSPEDHDRLLAVVQKFLGRRGSQPTARRRRPALMFQGTSSGAGKSVLTAAWCRILLQDGYSVAPFKAQNMSLNSFVTRTGGEMGRAQVVQAQAARLEPDVRMNPVLLKPNSDTGCQVIVWGQPVGNMDVDRYIDYKADAFAQVRRAYDELAQDHDVLVLEGAGSPAEVNLKGHDIVNMTMARYARAQVLLVGDIDRGGVYASFLGTMDVLDEWERSLVMGFLVNRFRGKKELLDDAHRLMKEATGRPVWGVVPYLQRLGLPEEDSVALKSGILDDNRPAGGGDVDIVVVDLPHISNFTDFDALRDEPDVRLRFVRQPEEVRGADAVVLPGSKNVLSDLAALRKRGWAEALPRFATEGVEIVGVCGGFQMLGEQISDPQGLESRQGQAPGVALLPLTTTLAPEKTLTRTQGRHDQSGCEVWGYEIHHGQTSATGGRACFHTDQGEVLGLANDRGRVWGTYLHGLFDADQFRRWFIDELRQRRGLEPLREVQVCYDVDQALDRLADVVRESMDVAAVYRRLGL